MTNVRLYSKAALREALSAVTINADDFTITLGNGIERLDSVLQGSIPDKDLVDREYVNLIGEYGKSINDMPDPNLRIEQLQLQLRK